MNSSADAQTLTSAPVNTESSTAWPVKLPPISPSSPFAPHLSKDDTDGSSNYYESDGDTYYDPDYDVWVKKPSNTSNSNSGLSPYYYTTGGNYNSGADSGMISSKIEDIDSSNLDNVDTGKWLDLIEEFLNKQYEYNQTSADKAMEFEREEAQKNREFQKLMSDTSYQRAMEDLRKAGINPLLAFSQFQGASTPSGSMASGSSASGSYGSPTSILYSMVNSLNGNKQMVGNLLKSILSIIGSFLL